MSQIEKSLFKIFSGYSMQANSYQSVTMRTSQMQQILEDASMLDDSLRPRDVNNLVYKVNGNSPTITFPRFLELVKEIAYHKHVREDALELFLNESLLPFAKAISQKLGTIKKSVLNISNDILLISKSLHRSFKFLFTKHFRWELENRLTIDQINFKSLKEMESLLKACEIYPGLINKTKFHGIWREIVIMQNSKFQTYLSSALIPKTSNDLGKVLTLSKFIMVFYYCAVYSLQGEDSFTGRFITLLEQVHLTLTKTYKSLNFMPPPSIMNKINNHTNYYMETEYSDDPLCSDRSIDEEINRYLPLLQTKFQEYSRKEFKIVQFRKFVKDCGLLRSVLRAVDVDLIFAKHSQDRKMNFQAFASALVEISKRTSLEALMNEHIFKSRDLLENNWELLKSEEMKESIQILSQPFSSILKKYNRNSVLDYAAFQQFCVDFEIFPDFVSKNKLNSVYAHLIQLEETLTASSDEQSEGIHPLSLCKGLAFISTTLFGNEYGLLEKFYMFIQVLMLSKGHKLTSNGTTAHLNEPVFAALSNIRRRFPAEFKKIQGRSVAFQDFAHTIVEKEFH